MLFRHLLLAHFAVAVSMAVFIDRELPNNDLYKPGDLVIAGMFPRSVQRPGQVCSEVKLRPAVQGASAMVYAIEQISASSSILPNISLGYVLMDDCASEAVALVKASQLVPIEQCIKDGCGIGLKNTSNLLTHGINPQYDVVCLIGPNTNAMQMRTSLLLSLYDVPHIGWKTTADDLSDKWRYKFFTRVIPPDRYQARALTDIIAHYNWTYISTLHSEGSYGSSGIRYIRQATKKLGVCIAFSHELRDDFTDDEFDWTVVQLRKNWKAKVVVYFVEARHGKRMMMAIERANAETEFITLSADGFLAHTVSHLTNGKKNWLALQLSGGEDPAFNSYYKQLPPFGTGDKIWSGEYNENLSELNCSWEVPNDNKHSCHRLKTYNDIESHIMTNAAVLIKDAIDTTGFALHNLISETCPEAFRNKALLKTCVNGPLVLKYIRNTKFKGASTSIEFDSAGDLVEGSYDIMSYSWDVKNKLVAKITGQWQLKTGDVEIEEDKVAWWRKTPHGDFVRTSEIPESVCAKPCQAGEFYRMGDLACCWECIKCRENEYLKSNGLGCDTCPTKTWPDQVNFSSCEPIPPKYMVWSDPIAIGLISMAGTFILTTILITIIFIKHRERKVIKGSNHELTAITIMGLFLAFACVFFFVAKAEDWICYANYLGFNLSCTLIFGPLFVKTLRMYRISVATERCEIKILGVDSKTQIIAVIIIFMIQVVINAAMCFYHPPDAEETMLVSTTRYVELSCLLPQVNLLFPLCYNILLLLLCAVFGFMTRKLPENFNESWYIFISVTTTLFVWIAFLPTYFMAFYAYHKSALLGFALILNGGVTVMCLFAPKLYALYFVDESGIKVTNFDFSEPSKEMISSIVRDIHGGSVKEPPGLTTMTPGSKNETP